MLNSNTYDTVIKLFSVNFLVRKFKQFSELKYVSVNVSEIEKY